MLAIGGARVAFTTDSYVVSPIFFPGGDIGDLAVNGTVNDLAMSGARPLYLSCGFILEEGFAIADLERVKVPITAVFGLKDVRLIAPACGSGHFLLGAFQRLVDKWLHIEPGTAERELVQRALDAVYGVDVNPYAVAIARFRLLVAALRASKLTTLRHAPGLRLNVAVGDSLLHGRRFETRRHAMDEVIDWLSFYNHRRLHSTLGYVSPMQFERAWLAAQEKRAA